jgi:hypothetical protein
MRRIIFWSLFLIGLLGLLGGIVIEKLEPPNSAARFTNSPFNFHKSGFFELEKLVIENFQSASINQNSNYWTQIGITSHHLPTALPFIVDFYKALLNSQGPREIFIILGPDHLEKCYAPVSTTKNSYLTPFGELYIDEEIVNELSNTGVYVDNQCFEDEHSIGVQAIFIKYLFPNAKIVPLIFSSSTGDNALGKIIDVLVKYKDRITIISSVDFSHHQFYDKAAQLDQISQQMIKGLDGSSFNVEYIDSPAVVKLAILLAKKIGSNDAIIIGRANSYDFTGYPENTTGYINAIFVNYSKNK